MAANGHHSSTVSRLLLGAQRLALSVLLLAAPATGSAQTAREFGVEGMALLRDSSLVGGAVYGGLRVTHRMRVALTGALGGGDGGLGARGELAGHFLLSPGLKHGMGLYGGGGLALEQQGDTRGYLELIIGAETNPGAASGWILEAGFGGGVRLALGWRARWFPK
ncbi:MAG TPA: hypothetical protein VFL88_11720 [Gemmatimonadales bacterium]|nr:hypothetical protein [Gemmatimonadales bacterium]